MKYMIYFCAEECECVSVGDPQMLLDTHAVKTLLLEVPSLGGQVCSNFDVPIIKVIIGGLMFLSRANCVLWRLQSVGSYQERSDFIKFCSCPG